MLICRARLRNTFNALTFRMSGEQIRLQAYVPRLQTHMCFQQMPIDKTSVYFNVTDKKLDW